MQIWRDHQNRIALELSRIHNDLYAIVTVRQKKKIQKFSLSVFLKEYRQCDTTQESLNKLINCWLTSNIKPSEKIKEVLIMAQNTEHTAEVKVKSAKNTGKKGRPTKESIYQFTAEPTVKLPKQASQILGLVRNKPMMRKELIEAMSEVIKTKQPIEKILVYYQKTLIIDGCLTIIEK